MPYPCRPLITSRASRASKANALKPEATGSLSCGVFALLVVPCDSRDLLGLSGGATRFVCADFRGADLGLANLMAAKLDGGCFVGADLGGANLAGASLQGANLTETCLKGQTSLARTSKAPIRVRWKAWVTWAVS